MTSPRRFQHLPDSDVIICGDPSTRHMGTIGSSIACNDPASDHPARALTLGATMKMTRRCIPAEDLFKGVFSSALDEDEILTETSFPAPERAGYGKFHLPASHYAMPSVLASRDDSFARVAVTDAGTCVFRFGEMEVALGNNFAPTIVLSIRIDPAELMSDIHASAEFRAHLVTVMAGRAVAEAVS